MSKSNVYTDLQQALAESFSGDEIWVAAGIYKPTATSDRSIAFEMVAGVKIYGGFIGTETLIEDRLWHLHETILSGDIGVSGDKSDNTYTVVKAAGSDYNFIGKSTVLDGFIIEDANNQLYGWEPGSGGGVICDNASPLIQNIVFRNNKARNDGGGAYIYNESEPTFINSFFINNESYMGAGVYLKSKASFYNCLWYNNKSVDENASYGTSLEGEGVDFQNYYHSSSEVVNSIIVLTEHNSAPYTSVYYDTNKASNLYTSGEDFVSSMDEDFRLRVGSSAINGGDNAFKDIIAKDFNGTERLKEEIIDKGPYEGGVLCPVNVSPAAFSTFDASGGPVTVNFKGHWDEEPQYSVDSYLLQYWSDVNDITTVAITSELSHSASFDEGQSVKWRLGAVLPDGSVNYSAITSFSLPHQNPIFVKEGGTGDGSSWQNAFGTISEAIGKATDGDQIWLAAGSYHVSSVNDKDELIEVTNNVKLYGGFAGTESVLTERDYLKNKTIVSGNIGLVDDVSDNSKALFLIRAIGEVLFDGISFQEAYQNVYINLELLGAAMRISSGDVTINNCIFRDNYTRKKAAAIGVIGGNVSVTNSLFKNNKALDYGGAISNTNGTGSIINCVFDGNSARGGSAVYDNNRVLKVYNCISVNDNNYYNGLSVEADADYSAFKFTWFTSSRENIDISEPYFIDPENDDYRLNSISPYINKGSNELLPEGLTKDFAGNNRIADETVDLGLYEGGIICPSTIEPAHFKVFKTSESTLEVNLNAGWADVEPTYAISRYFIEYWTEEGAKASIESSSAFAESVTLSSGKEYYWRAGVETDAGVINYSPTAKFTIGNDKPLFVKEGSSGDGSSWANAMGTLQEAINTAVEGDEIWVAKGTYYTNETDPTISYMIKSGITLYGGFDGAEATVEERNWRNNPTILSGNIGDELEELDNTYQIFKCAIDATVPFVLDGFIVSGAYSYNSGGGISLTKGEVQVLNCIFENNRANEGAAIDNSESVLKCYNTIFRGNTTNRDYVINGYDGDNTITNCLFVNNQSYANIIGNGEVNNCIIWDNELSGSATSNISVYNSCIEGRTTENGIIGDDPLFMDVEAGDYRLHYQSPCINAGDNDKLPETLKADFYGADRIADDVVDMGIAEGGVVTPLAVSPENHSTIKAEQESLEVELVWAWEAGKEASDIASYTIEYWYDDGVINQIENLTELKHNLLVNAGSKVNWRINTVFSGGEVRKGIKQVFFTTHTHPLFVKEGASGDGSSWSSALGSLQEAFELAVNRDEIWVAAGTYKPAEADRLKSFDLKGGLMVYGGFAGTEAAIEERNWMLNPTVISGEIGDESIYTDNSTRLLNCDVESNELIVIDGFIMEAAYANMSDNSYDCGAALYLNKGNVRVENCKFRDNKARYTGGAINNYNAQLEIVNSLFISNSANSGGAIYNSSGMIKLINSTVFGNTTNYFAGGICNSSDVNHFQVSNTIIWANTAPNYNNVYRLKAANSIIGEDSSFNGETNVQKDPMFIAPDKGDFRLNQFSPAINFGANDSIPEGVNVDFAKADRIQDEVVDAGYLEGGHLMPETVAPKSNAIVEGVFLGTEVTFEWAWPEAYTAPDYDTFTLEYWVNADNKTQVEGLTELSYTASLSNGNEYQWRIIAVKGELEYPSVISNFSLTHDYALRVKAGGGSYDRWKYAYENLQDAINAAVRGDDIWVAEGTYLTSKTDDREESVYIDKQIRIYGGFKGSEVYLEDRPLNPGKTIVSGNIGLEGVNTDNAYRVMHINIAEADSVVIDGFTISDGYADGSYGNDQVAGVKIDGKGICTLNHMIVKDNEASSVGGGVFANTTTHINNTLIVNNVSGNNSGGLAASECNVYVNNSTIYGNEAEYGAGGIYSNFRGDFFVNNSIVWGNSGDVDVAGYRNSEYQYSCIEGMNTGTVIGSDPLFVDAENGNFRLLPTSPCINAGNNELLPDGLRADLDDLGRVSWATVDMGAYEASYPKTVRPADKAPARPTGVLGYTWTLGADIDGVTPNPNLMERNDYRASLKAWDVDDESNVYEEMDNIASWGFMSFNYEHRKGYEWRVGIQTEAYTYWSDTATFYIGGTDPLYVKAGATGDGSSWTNAYGTIEEAVEAAVKGDQVWVANGTYHVTDDNDKAKSLKLESYIALYGGFDGVETQEYERFNSKEKTIISGDIGTVDDGSDNTETLISIKGTAEQPVEGVVIDGFTLEHANGTGMGGAIKAEHAHYQVLNSYLSDNAAGEGAAIYNTASKAYVYNSQIDNNTSGSAVVYGDENSELEIVNATLVANSSGIASPGSIANTIVYSNGGTQLSGVEANYSCIEGGYDGTDNVDADPDFMNAAEKDYRLGQFSSCFDKGSDSYLPGFAFMDLYKNERRTFYSQVDIGASEVGPFQLGRVKMTGSTPADKASDVDYNIEVKVAFNKPIEPIQLNQINVGPDNPFYYSDMNSTNDTLVVTMRYDAALDFDKTYAINIPAEAIVFANNSKIPSEAVDISFTVRSCQPAVLVPQSKTYDACLFEAIELPVALSGDYIEGYTWMKADTVFSDSDDNATLFIEEMKDKYLGTYTFKVDDMCGNTISEEVSISMKSTNAIVLRDKWDDVLFVDNADGHFSDFNWYVNGDQVETRQYFDMANNSGDVYVTAVDAQSGCTAYSDTIAISGGGLKAMTVNPNPVQRSQQITIKLPEKQSLAKVSLYDLTGALIVQDEYENTRIINYTNTNVKPGVYLIEVVAEGLVEQRKIIIQK